MPLWPSRECMTMEDNQRQGSSRVRTGRRRERRSQGRASENRIASRAGAGAASAWPIGARRRTRARMSRACGPDRGRAAAQPVDARLSPCPARPELGAFTHTDPWRVLRIQGEFVHGINALAEVGAAVAVFGSARFGRRTSPVRGRPGTLGQAARRGRLRRDHRRRARASWRPPTAGRRRPAGSRSAATSSSPSSRSPTPTSTSRSTSATSSCGRRCSSSTPTASSSSPAASARSTSCSRR